MNCRKAERLIPLFVEADLEAAAMQQVTEHLQTCAACQNLAAEFQTSQSALHAMAVPVFDEAMMAQMRSAVQRELAQTATQPSFTVWLSPLWNWKIAFAGVMAVLLLVGGIVVPQRSAKRNIERAKNNALKLPSPAPRVDVMLDEPRSERTTAARVFLPRTGRKKIARGEVSVSKRNPGNNAPTQASPERATDVDSQIAAAIAEADNASAKLPVVDPLNSILSAVPQSENITQSLEKSAPEPEMLRMEFQTADPNIRIIWFTPKEPNIIQADKDTK